MTATARRPPAVGSLLLAARCEDARARCSSPIGRPPIRRRLDTRPPLGAVACAFCAERGASLAPCLPARSRARGRDGSTAARRRVAAARRSSRRRSRAAATTRRPPAIESLLLAACPSDARALLARARSVTALRRLGAQPPLDAAACASCAERSASLTPCFAARSHARGRDGSTATRRRVAAARRSSRRRSRALLAPARSAAAFATPRHSAVARCGGLRLLRRTRRVSCAVLPCRSHARGRDGSTAARRRVAAARRSSRRARARCSRSLGRPPRSRRLDTWPPLVAAAFASCAKRGASLALCSSARSHARGRNGSTAARRRVAAARRSSRRRSRALLAPARSAAAFATARHSAAARRGGLRLLR